MIYNAPTWVNNGAPALNASRLQALCDAVEQDGIEIQTLQQQQANPYNFKGDVAAVTNLPGSGNTVNDTYYVTGAGALYTWTGSSWEQSSVSANDYSLVLSAIKANFADTYDQTDTYAVGDYCVHNDNLYRCTTAISTPETWNALHWTAVSVGGELENIQDDWVHIIRITSTATTMGTIATQLNSINSAGDHVLFDVSALGAGMYLCTIFIDTVNSIYKIFDLVTGRFAEGTYSSTNLLTMAIAQSTVVATQQQIDYLQNEIDELGGKSVLTSWDVLGDLILSGDSPNTIESGDITTINWITSVLGTTTSGLTVSCSDMNTFITAIGECEAKDYLFVYNGSNWTYNEEVVTLSDYALSVTGTPATGEVMDIKTTVNAVPYTFTSYDTVNPVNSNVTHNWLLEQTYAPSTKVYDTYEALFCVQAGKTLPANKYYIPMYSYRSSKTFNVCFEITGAMGATTKIQAKSNGNSNVTTTDATGASISGVYRPSSLTPIVYGTGANAGSNISLLFLSDTDVASGNYVLLSSVNSSNNTIVTIGDFDKAALGSNTWPLSNMANWLNDDTMGDNYTPTSDFDIASSYNRGNGFLWGMDPRVRALIQTAEVQWTAGYGNADYTQGTTYTANQNVFLLSMKEMSFDINTNEGVMTGLYGTYTNNTLTNGAVANRAKYSAPGGTINSYRWSRSVFTSDANDSRSVTSTGSISRNYARIGYNFAPAFIIGKSAS